MMKPTDALESAISLMSEKDATFATSMVEWSRQHGSLTPRQEKWARILLERVGIPLDNIEWKPAA